METQVLNHHTTILQIIKHHLGPCTIFTLEENQNNPCLVAFANPKNPRAAATAANRITEKTNTTVTLLLHKATDLNTSQQDQQWFFYHALRGQRLALDKAAVPYWPHDHIPEREWEGAEAFWLKCEAVANFNIAAVSESPQLEVGLIKIALLHEAMVQIALGLIRACLGYTPNNYGLRFLLQLCGHFCDLPARAFPQDTPEQQLHYKRLCTPSSMLRHWTRLDAPERDVELLLDACGVFLNDAKELVERTLQNK
ncbi:MAG: hypothetical protein EOO68_23620 [Moraxellaceae bacterium]|nr:MAG: hypothetical protein EOO68_23620 [Moraxellaceae bacterium]